MSRRIAALLIAAAALALVVTGFAGASSTTTRSTQVNKVPSIAKLVPAKIRSKGSLVVATDATYAPMEFIASNGKTVVWGGRRSRQGDRRRARAELQGHQ